MEKANLKRYCHWMFSIKTKKNGPIYFHCEQAINTYFQSSWQHDSGCFSIDCFSIVQSWFDDTNIAPDACMLYI